MGETGLTLFRKCAIPDWMRTSQVTTAPATQLPAVPLMADRTGRERFELIGRPRISSAKEQWAFRLPASAILGAFDDSTAEKYMGRVQEALEEVDVELELVGTFAPLQYTVHLRVDLESETATVDGDTYCVSPQMADHINFFKLGLHRSKEAGHET